MDIIVSGRKINMSEKIRTYAEERVKSATRVFDIPVVSADVVLKREGKQASKDTYEAEITLRVKGRVIRAAAQSDDLQAAIDIAADKSARQLRKYKTKTIDKKAKNAEGLSEVAFSPEDLVELGAEIEREQEEEESVVRIKELELQPLSLEEALIQTDLLGHDFFVYIDEVTGLTNVLYRRKGGGYGLIKPKVETQES